MKCLTIESSLLHLNSLAHVNLHKASINVYIKRNR